MAGTTPTSPWPRKWTRSIKHKALQIRGKDHNHPSHFISVRRWVSPEPQCSDGVMPENKHCFPMTALIWNTGWSWRRKDEVGTRTNAVGDDQNECCGWKYEKVHFAKGSNVCVIIPGLPTVLCHDSCLSYPDLYSHCGPDSNLCHSLGSLEKRLCKIRSLLPQDADWKAAWSCSTYLHIRMTSCIIYILKNDPLALKYCTSVLYKRRVKYIQWVKIMLFY